MSDEARIALVVTDDSWFSAQVSEFMLRAGVQTLQFARSDEALQRARDTEPNVILIHIPRERLDTGWTCYEQLVSDPTISQIPILVYAPPLAREREVGGTGQGLVADPLELPDTLAARISSLAGTVRPARAQADSAPSEDLFLTGRDDM